MAITNTKTWIFTKSEYSDIISNTAKHFLPKKGLLNKYTKWQKKRSGGQEARQGERDWECSSLAFFFCELTVKTNGERQRGESFSPCVGIKCNGESWQQWEWHGEWIFFIVFLPYEPTERGIEKQEEGTAVRGSHSPSSHQLGSAIFLVRKMFCSWKVTG